MTCHCCGSYLWNSDLGEPCPICGTEIEDLEDE